MNTKALIAKIERLKLKNSQLTQRVGQLKGNQWISVETELPDKTVLVSYVNSHGKQRTVKAFYAKRWEVEQDCDDDENCVEYSEEKDNYYLIEGWYEVIDNWGEYSSIFINEGKVTDHMPLPSPPKDI